MIQLYKTLSKLVWSQYLLCLNRRLIAQQISWHPLQQEWMRFRPNSTHRWCVSGHLIKGKLSLYFNSRDLLELSYFILPPARNILTIWMLTLLMAFKVTSAQWQIQLWNVSERKKVMKRCHLSRGLASIPYLGHQIYVYHNFLTMRIKKRWSSSKEKLRQNINYFKH